MSNIPRRAAPAALALSAVLALGALAQSTPRPTAGACVALDLVSEGMRLTFEDRFDHFDRFDGQRGVWQTEFVWGGRTIPTNREMQVYVDPGFKGGTDAPLGLNPFSLRDGMLVISATEADAATSAWVGGARYLSGLITTAPSFQQTYGYFEIRARMPAGAGLWPAFWLLPPAGQWPPEIDVLEVIGHEPTRLHVSVHSAQTGEAKGTSRTLQVPDLSRAAHSFGVLWTPERVSWFFEGCRVAEVPTPADMHQPMYMLVNLAVGGNWPGPPNRQTQFPAELVVDHVRAYALR